MCVHKVTPNGIEIEEFDDTCDYVDAGKVISCEPHDLKVIHLNIRGLNSKLFELNELIDSTFKPHQPEIVLLSETWLKQHSPIPSIAGYRLERCDRTTKKGGGVGILISNRCKYQRRTDMEKLNNDSFESCFVELQAGKTNVLIGSIYRPPNTSCNTFTSTLRSTLEQRMGTRNIMIGLDHNLDLLKCEIHRPTQSFMEMLYDSNITPTITKPTRITTSSATLIDNILVNVELAENISSGIINEHISDHLPCYNIISGLKAIKKPKLQVTSRDLRPKNITALKRRLESDPNLLLPQHEDSVDNQFEEFHKKLLDEIDHFLPERTRRINTRSIRRELWVSPGLLISIKHCKKLYRKHLKNQSNKQIHAKYKRYNSELKRTKRAAMKQYYNAKCTEHRDNTRKLWQTINQVIKKKNNKTEVIEALIIENIHVTSGSVIVNEFGKYYSTVGKKLAEGMPSPRRTVASYLKEVESNQKSIFLMPVTEVEIRKIIGKLLPKHSSGIDNINNKILKELGDLIVYPLTKIFNNSLCEGIFPRAMKQAKVVPLYKSKNRELTTNYRPISLLLTLSKILEKLMYSRVYKFLCTTNQLYVSQYGFRKQHSCEHAVGELVARITKGMETGKFTAGIFLDLSKAFDTLEHDVVYAKLEKYGLRGTCLQWFQSYLSDRTMLVSCKAGETGNEYKSETYTVTYGTPQGSCLGPLIFLIFCNDLQNHLMFLSCIQFADDTTLYITHKSIDYIKFCIETDLNTLQDWFIANKLTLNVSKSVCILFSKNKQQINLNISLGGIGIPQVTSTKFLGMWIDQALTWNDHVSKTILRLKARTNLLNMGKKFLSTHALRVLYFAQIHSILTYGIVMWGSLLSQANLNKLQKIQNICVRIIDNKKSTNNEDRYKTLGILTVRQTIQLELSKLWHKHQKNLLPKRLTETMSLDQNEQSLQKVHCYNTRNKTLSNRPLAKSWAYEHSFLVEGLRTYSNLPPEIVQIENYIRFSKQVKRYLLNL